MTRYMQTLACRFHPDAPLIEDYRAGDMICPMCGLVVGERMVDVSERWPTSQDSADAKDRSRVGAAENLLYGSTDLATTTTTANTKGSLKDSGRQIGSRMISQISPADKTLRDTHRKIQSAAAAMGLTKRVIDQAFITFKQCFENKCLRGRPENVIISSCIYTACRQQGSPRTVKEIAEHSKVTSKEIGRCYLKIKGSLANSSSVQQIDIKDLVPRFCNELALEQKILIRKAVTHIVQRATEICNIQGRSPTSIVSGAIYLACSAANENITKKDIEKATGASPSTIGIIYKLMLPNAAKLFPHDFVFKRPVAELPRPQEGQGQYKEAVLSHEKALWICGQILSHPELARVYNNIGTAYHKLGNYSKALQCCEKAQNIYANALSPNHQSLAASHLSFAELYQRIGDYLSEQHPYHAVT
ncbi:unnamed protein product [Rotaria socialis]|uniref:Transcription initiation factor IIB n=1 Tax=Rotaria socialis TaxID=392032 RepID=A0A821CTS5_9BILA|nr:unnamed protein product [Rotaria socialis]